MKTFQHRVCSSVDLNSTLLKCHVSRAEQLETFPWQQIGDSQIVWPLFVKPDSLAGRKFFSALVPRSHHVLTLY